MATNSEFRAFVLDQLEPLGGVTARAMFGGAGLYRDATMFALVTRSDVLYFRTDDANTGEYEAAGMGPFKPFDDKPHTMPYHEVPADLLEDPDELCAWAGRAWEAARRAKDGKKKKRKARRGRGAEKE